jgi:hypothetical protein
MRFFIDECLMPTLAEIAIEYGYEATSVRDRGMTGAKDWDIAKYVIENDLILVTHNSKDFRGKKGQGGYLTNEEIYPGLVCLNAYNELEQRHIDMNEKMQKSLLKTALKYMSDKKILDLINHVIEVNYDGISTEITLYQAPTLG